MAFQKTVNRAYTTGFAGEIVRDGPTRARVARIVAPTSPVGAVHNRFSRAFGYAGDLSVVGSGNSETLAADCPTVEVGGANFFGLLIHPKHHVLAGFGGNALAPTYELPMGTEAEFASMATGLVVEIANQDTTAKDVNVGWSLAYVSSTTTPAENPQGLELGSLIAYTGAVPAGFTPIPNSRVMNPVSIAPSAAGAVVSAVTWVSLTQ